MAKVNLLIKSVANENKTKNLYLPALTTPNAIVIHWEPQDSVLNFVFTHVSKQFSSFVRQLDILVIFLTDSWLEIQENIFFISYQARRNLSDNFPQVLQNLALAQLEV
jgi:hypothetical protein